MESEDNLSNLRVASFSYYIQAPEDSLVLKLAGNQGELVRNQHELGIFGADKYFDMKTEYENGIRKEGLVDRHLLKARITPRTPSMTSSEASSWNSQSALLQDNQRRNPPSQAKQGRGVGKRFFHNLGCQGPCFTKKAVYVNEISNPGFNKEGQVTFPVVNAKTEEKKAEGFIKQRKSIEVFGSKTLKKGDIVKDLERKLSVLTWDAIPKARANLSSSANTHGSSTTTIACDDMASDASSDLFEIENISGTVGTFLMSPPSQYAPSETSIDWSVMTASAAEFSSVYSDHDENTATANVSKTGQKNTKARPSGLLGCKSYKAVRVAEPKHKTNSTDKPKHN